MRVFCSQTLTNVTIFFIKTLTKKIHFVSINFCAQHILFLLLLKYIQILELYLKKIIVELRTSF